MFLRVMYKGETMIPDKTEVHLIHTKKSKPGFYVFSVFLFNFNSKESF